MPQSGRACLRSATPGQVSRSRLRIRRMWRKAWQSSFRSLRLGCACCLRAGAPRFVAKIWNIGPARRLALRKPARWQNACGAGAKPLSGAVRPSAGHRDAAGIGAPRQPSFMSEICVKQAVALPRAMWRTIQSCPPSVRLTKPAGTVGPCAAGTSSVRRLKFAD